MKKLDILVVGQGLAGSLLSIELLRTGLTVHVLDENPDVNSSKVAAGLYNPITGRNMVKTWLADEIYPWLPTYYDELQKLLQANFHFPSNIYRPFANVEEQNDWATRSVDPIYRSYIDNFSNSSKNIKHVIDPFGGVVLKKCGTVSVIDLLQACRTFLKNKGLYSSQLFDFSALQLVSGGVIYNGIQAKNIIFCEGAQLQSNPLFNQIRLNLVKGEILDVKCNYNSSLILNKGVFMVPRHGFVRIGSTYDRDELSDKPTEKGKNQILEKLSKIYDGEIEILAHRAGVRPATYDRRPFIGFRPDLSQIGIFNGFGTKGVSLIPYFAKRMVSHILENEPLTREVNPGR